MRLGDVNVGTEVTVLNCEYVKQSQSHLSCSEYFCWYHGITYRTDRTMLIEKSPIFHAVIV